MQRQDSNTAALERLEIVDCVPGSKSMEMLEGKYVTLYHIGRLGYRGSLYTDWSTIKYLIITKLFISSLHICVDHIKIINNYDIA